MYPRVRNATTDAIAGVKRRGAEASSRFEPPPLPPPRHSPHHFSSHARIIPPRYQAMPLRHPVLAAASVALLAASAAAFAPQYGGAPALQQQQRAAASATALREGAGEEEFDISPGGTQKRIQAMVDDSPVLLFMKGSKIFPQCGFSNTAVQILQSFNIDFETVDVLADEAVRQGVKEFSQWPTIPQLYIGGEFVGGADIVQEMGLSGELQTMLDAAPKRK